MTMPAAVVPLLIQACGVPNVVLVDVVVVYKIGRLSRCLIDFAKLAEVFDQHDVTFVSVTQSFNTTSMGRLMLNILLPFAQFEREVIGERVRDTRTASFLGIASECHSGRCALRRCLTKALGFSGLDDLRRTLADELRSSLSPAERLTRTLGEVGASLSAAFDMTLEIHLQSLESLRRTITPEQFEKAVGSIVWAQRVLVFGLGPSSAMAAYLIIQLGRFGLDAAGLMNTGLLFADDLQKLRKGDLVIILAYGRVYAELAVLLDEIDRLGVGSLLLTDTLAAKLRRRVDQILPVARARADMLSMHTATLGLIKALLVASRPRDPLKHSQA